MSEQTEAESAGDDTALELAGQYIVTALEERLPGLLDRAVELAEAAEMHAEIRRMGSPAPNPEKAATVHRSLVIVRRWRFVTAALLGAARRKRKGRG